MVEGVLLSPTGSIQRLPSTGGAGGGGGGGLAPSGSMPRLPSGLLSPSGSVQRVPSGNLYDNFPCVRVGDVNLPSSMDLREWRCAACAQRACTACPQRAPSVRAACL